MYLFVYTRGKFVPQKNAALAFALLSQTFKKSFFADSEVWKPHSD